MVVEALNFVPECKPSAWSHIWLAHRLRHVPSSNVCDRVMDSEIKPQSWWQMNDSGLHFIKVLAGTLAMTSQGFKSAKTHESQRSSRHDATPSVDTWYVTATT